MREKEKYIAHIAITLPSRRLLRQERQFITGAYLSYWCASVISNHFQRVSLVGQMVKKLPEIQETPVQSLGQEDPLEKPQYSCLGNSMDKGAWLAMVHGVTKESETT